MQYWKPKIKLTRINLFSLTGILLSKIYCAASSIEENSVPIEPALTLPIVIIFDVLLFKHQHLNASPYGFAGVYRQCRCVITVCTRKSPACHKVCNFNKIYCPFFRFNINKDNVHKSIISWSRSVHEKRCIGVSIKLNIYRKCWKISNINEDLTIL